MYIQNQSGCKGNFLNWEAIKIEIAQIQKRQKLSLIGNPFAFFLRAI